MTQRQISAETSGPFQGSLEAHDRQKYFYPPMPTLEQPPAARINYAKRFSEQTTEGTRIHSSVSSASGSSGLSYQKQQIPSPASRWPSPTIERTLVNSDQYNPHQSIQWQQIDSTRVGHSHNRSEMAETNSPALAYIRERRQIEEEVEEEENENDHAMWVLFWLSCLDPLHSFACCLFTLFVTFGLVLASPIRLVHKQNSFGDQLIRTVAPLFKNHLEMMYAVSVEYAFEWDFRPGMLIIVHLIAPLISMGVAVAAWITGAFWVFANIMGNPDGTERRDDGADAVLAVRNWWESCLLKAIRPRVRPSMRSVV
ncbi:hypothetical protein PMZ80_003866 [Knufia obscura]|uniref:Uncharacterized protein n=2 Tax=Knufia TaxID=430999 RepID=A0AAN8I919_9EURO|nr:hypothetical protein PMZ80_003866 [Knufia obscura]KAK5958219.1 hypothetical protein OHC33_000061 [Knufia fluminis]